MDFSLAFGVLDEDDLDTSGSNIRGRLSYCGPASRLSVGPAVSSHDRNAGHRNGGGSTSKSNKAADKTVATSSREESRTSARGAKKDHKRKGLGRSDRDDFAEARPKRAAAMKVVSYFDD